MEKKMPKCEGKMGKRCPVCNSTRYKKSEKGSVCLKCGYINKKEIQNPKSKNRNI